jgi:hypothetical protein
MNAKNLFTVVAILCLLFGLGLTFAPNFMGEQYLTNPSWINEGAKLLAQGWGSLLMVTGVACWYIRNAGPSLGRKVMLLFSLLSNLALIVIHLMAILNRVETSLAWVQVLMALIIAGWAGMLFRQEPSLDV